MEFSISNSPLQHSPIETFTLAALGERCSFEYPLALLRGTPEQLRFFHWTRLGLPPQPSPFKIRLSKALIQFLFSFNLPDAIATNIDTLHLH
jgi:hypothetical protein